MAIDVWDAPISWVGDDEVTFFQLATLEEGLLAFVAIAEIGVVFEIHDPSVEVRFIAPVVAGRPNVAAYLVAVRTACLQNRNHESRAVHVCLAVALRIAVRVPAIP